ncbi:MAG: hypothetical protein JXR83_02625 [Deltaproteobacteria bacterium]|nr:hypothetical protein [Deltaproteobacteria bacterium]
MRLRWSPLWLVVALAAAPPALAQDLHGTRPLGMGEAYRSLASGNEALYYNPAGITAVARYSPELHYQFNLDRALHEVDLSVVDSVTNALGVGIGYTFVNREPGDQAVQGHRATLALAYPILPGMFNLGAGFKYLNISQALAGNFVSALTADVGVILTPGLGLSFALVGYNLVPITSNEAPLSMAAAASWSMEGLTLAFDWTLDLESLSPPGMGFHGGAEYLLFDMFPLRVGYENDQVRQQSAITFGTGFVLEWFGIDLAYQQRLERFDDRTFGVALKFYLFQIPSPTATPGTYRPNTGSPLMPGAPGGMGPQLPNPLEGGSPVSANPM